MEAVLIPVLVVQTGILIKKFRNPELTLKASTTALINDAKEFCIGNLKPLRNRIQFDNLLWCDLEKILAEYIKQGARLQLIKPSSSASTVHEFPIGFIANHDYSKEEVLDIANYVSSTFNTYLIFRDKPNIKHFITYAQNTQRGIFFYIHYAEFEEDFAEFEKLYWNWLNRNSSNCGILRDEKLEEELKNV